MSQGMGADCHPSPVEGAGLFPIHRCAFSNEAGGNEKRVLEPILLKKGEGQIRVAHMSVIKVEEYSSLSGQGPWPTGALSKRGIRAQPQHGLVSEKLRIREHRASVLRGRPQDPPPS